MMLSAGRITSKISSSMLLPVQSTCTTAIIKNFLFPAFTTCCARGADLRGFATDLHLPFGTPAEYAQAEQEANKAAFEMLM